MNEIFGFWVGLHYDQYMPESKIRQIGDPTLHKAPIVVDFNNPKHVAKLPIDYEIMKRNLYAAQGVGIAANQCREIAEPMQMAIIGSNEPHVLLFVKDRMAEYVDDKNKSPSAFEEILIINPKLEPEDNETHFLVRGEGCLSLSLHFHGMVPRFSHVKVKYFDLKGLEHTLQLSGFMADIAQHETDHLLGSTYFDKLMALWNVEDRQHLMTLIQAHLSSAADISMRINPDLIAFDANAKDGIVTDWGKVVEVIKKCSKTELLAILKRMKNIETHR